MPRDPASPPHATNPKLDELAAALREAISALSDPDDAKWFVASLLDSPNAASLDLAGAQQLAAMASSDAFEADLVAAVRAGCADTSPDILGRLVADVRA